MNISCFKIYETSYGPKPLCEALLREKVPHSQNSLWTAPGNWMEHHHVVFWNAGLSLGVAKLSLPSNGWTFDFRLCLTFWDCNMPRRVTSVCRLAPRSKPLGLKWTPSLSKKGTFSWGILTDVGLALTFRFMKTVTCRKGPWREKVITKATINHPQFDHI